MRRANLTERREDTLLYVILINFTRRWPEIAVDFAEILSEFRSQRRTARDGSWVGLSRTATSFALVDFTNYATDAEVHGVGGDLSRSAPLERVTDLRDKIAHIRLRHVR